MSLLIRKTARFETSGLNVRWVPIENLVPAVDPSEKMGLGDAQRLAELIKKNGYFEAIEVAQYGDDPKLYIEDGNTRYAAAKVLGMKQVPVGDVQLGVKKNSKQHENASTQINVPPSVAQEIIRIGRELIPDEYLAGEGRVMTPHVTVKYGVQPNEQALRQAITGRGSFSVALGKTEVFVNSENNAGGTPVVVEVHGHELTSLHKLVMDAIGTMPDSLPYIPHITIAYVKANEAQHFAGSDAFDGISFSARALTLSMYDDNNQVNIPLEGALPVTAAAPAVQPEIQKPQAEIPGQVQRDEPATPQPQQEQERNPAAEPEEPEVEDDMDDTPKPKPEHSTFPLPEQTDQPRDRRDDEQRPVVQTKAFKKWFANSKVVDDEGNPLIVYHGTTHDVKSFNPNLGNVENHYGKGMYFTDSKVDVAANYATDVGPDITSRIENVAERIFNDLQEEWDQEHPGEDFPEYGSGEYEEIMGQAKEQAKEGIVGEHGGATVPVYLSMQNPVIVQKHGGTMFEYHMDEETNEESGTAVDLWTAVTNLAGEYNFDGQELWNDISGNLGPEFDAYDFEQLVRKNSGVTNDMGDQAQGEFIKDVYQYLNFDGIIMDAFEAFGSKRQGKPMKMDYDTKHYIPFSPTQVKSALGAKKFDPKDTSLTAAVTAAGATGVGDLGLARNIMTEMMSVLPAELPKPELKIVNQPRANWLGRDTWRIGVNRNTGVPIIGENTVIELQKSILNDETTLRRVIAHELAHHAEHLTDGVQAMQKVRDEFSYKSFLRENGHGKTWKAWAQKFNAKYGADFVTEKSDETYVTERQKLQPYHILLKRDYDGKLAYEVSSRMSAKQKRYLDRLAKEKDAEYRLTTTEDYIFINGHLIGSFYWVHPKDAEVQQKLEELWGKAQKVLPSGASDEQDDLLKLMRERMTGPGWQKNPKKSASVIPNGTRVNIQSRGHWDDGGWGIVTMFDGENYHVAMYGDMNMQPVFSRSELRVPKKTAAVPQVDQH
jgi:2'-5' RNA ligase